MNISKFYEPAYQVETAVTRARIVVDAVRKSEAIPEGVMFEILLVSERDCSALNALWSEFKGESDLSLMQCHPDALTDSRVRGTSRALVIFDAGVDPDQFNLGIVRGLYNSLLSASYASHLPPEYLILRVE
ncbi:hypothetical protein H1O16_gp191 [Burkholderia phage BcepSaruman]|uniref:Uncharacterized protein n=1 Tax=Burkholderia phage BcepSaruman TaxID=2530032 RepID=A0A4D5ZCB5_9CAUD|nr:hypothetical protein H1O16_gp191 [Burkholderia phage BcepSaruman]QBX06604.1 hypothetical protein BcepSaruman_191 [Burkholderia phage BcepSaruman]